MPDAFPPPPIHTPIYTIGYGPRDVDAFLGALVDYGIQYLIDVRSYPDTSGYRSDFARTALTPRLRGVGVAYLFMGNDLGGRPRDARCYVDGAVDYDALSRTAAYRRGVHRLLDAWRQERVVALMCAEGDPAPCHRSRLIGESLTRLGVAVAHITPTGELVTQHQLRTRSDGGQQRLFEHAV